MSPTKIAEFLVDSGGDATLIKPISPNNYLVAQTGGIQIVWVWSSAPLGDTVIEARLAIFDEDLFVPILDAGGIPQTMKIGARPMYAFVVGTKLKFTATNYGGTPVRIKVLT